MTHESAPPPGERTRLLAATIPALILVSVGMGIWIARVAPRSLPTLVLGGLGALLLGWILLSTLWPSRADRRCPRCGEDSLERIDRTRTVGLRCEGCGWRDETASAWYLAEADDAPLPPPE